MRFYINFFSLEYLLNLINYIDLIRIIYLTINWNLYIRSKFVNLEDDYDCFFRNKYFLLLIQYLFLKSMNICSPILSSIL